MTTMKAAGNSVINALGVYLERVRDFRPNAQLYLVYVVLFGIGMGIFQVLFNFYVLSQGFDEKLLGNLITANHLTSLIVALPMGYLADRLGQKRSLILTAVMYGVSVIVMVVFPGVFVFVIMNILMGIAQSLSTITQGPFLMENSGEKERTYLFSFSFGLRMTAASVGNWIGGYLPTWAGSWQGVDPESTVAYGWALAAMGGLVLLGLLPLLRMQGTYKGKALERSMFLPLAYLRRHQASFSKLILPTLVTSFGAGLFMSFMNLFFKNVHHISDQGVGALFAWGSLAMGVGLLIAPPFAEKLGKIQLVVLTQGLSIPFMILLGFSPWFPLAALAYYARLMTMNMSTPVYQTFMMESVEPEARATAASLHGMAWNFGRAFSPTVSGYLQVSYGFGPVFLIAIGFYTIAIFMYWRFFLKRGDQQSKIPLPL